MKRNKQSPIFSKTYDFILWLLNHTESLPKSERFRLARRLEDTAFEFYHLLMKAARSTKRKRAILLDADLTLEKLQLYIRLSHDRGHTTHKQYRYASKKLLEIGNLLGGSEISKGFKKTNLIPRPSGQAFVQLSFRRRRNLIFKARQTPDSSSVGMTTVQKSQVRFSRLEPTLEISVAG